MHGQAERSSSESYFWPIIWAVSFHVLMFAMLFVSFAMTPELPPSRPIVQATLYQLKSQSQATVQTNQKIAGEAKKTKAPTHETEQLEQKKNEQEKLEVAKAAEQKKAEEVKKAAEAKKADEAKKSAEQKKLADVALKKKAEEEKKKAAAEEEKKKKAAEDAKKKKAAEEAKKKATADAKKKATAEAAKRKAAEDKKAQALAELLSDTTDYQQAVADTQGDQVAGSLDDLIRIRSAESWTRPPGANNTMEVVLQINMLPDGTVTNVSVARSSGNPPFDSSAVAAVKNIGRLVEMQGLSPAEFNPYRSFKMTFTPEDLAP